LDGGHGAYPVVDGHRLVGMIRRTDLLTDADRDGATVAPRVEEVVSVHPLDRVQDAVRVMLDEHVDHVPVVDGDATLVGICTRSDLLKLRRRQLELERVDGSLRSRLRRPTSRRAS